MSAFSCEDVVAFKADRSLIGTINWTWSDVEDDSHDDHYGRCFFKPSLPRECQKAFLREGVLSKGLVVIEFAAQAAYICIAAEEDLILLDRALLTGDVVKKNFSDAQSGVVIGTALKCTLSPVCSTDDFSRAGSLFPDRSHGRSQISSRASDNRNSTVSQISQPTNPGVLSVSAQEIKDCIDFREDDIITYRGWVGQVHETIEEVTVRLSNGSVVVVEEPDDLDGLPSTSWDTAPQRLGSKLKAAGYTRSVDLGSDDLDDMDAFFVGQLVQTKKGNLRRGRWTFGAYDPNVMPRGIIVDIRIVGLQVRWFLPLSCEKFTVASDEFPTTFDNEPPTVLNSDVLQSNEVTVYNDAFAPPNPKTPVLSQSSSARNLFLGRKIRFRDPVRAATEHSGRFNHIPRTSTQGFDLNVLRVTDLRTTCLIRWQDGSISTHSSDSLFPIATPDERDVFPGDRVSFLPDEEPLKESPIPTLRTCTVGVVQSVDALERMATVRWFKETQMDLDAEHKEQSFEYSTFGEISDRMTESSLYELAAYPALAPLLGDYAIVDPGKLQAPSEISAICLGEVVELCLDGDIVLRCGTSQNTVDLKVGSDGLKIMPRSVFEDEDDSDSSSADVIDDELAWSDESGSEEESPHDSRRGSDTLGGSDTARNKRATAEIDSSRETDDGPINDTTASSSPQQPSDTECEILDLDLHDEIGPKATSIRFTRFAILDTAPPEDHHFFSKTTELSAKLMRRMAREHSLMADSLPDGIFVRTWDSRLDLLRVLIIGPIDTPYEHTPFMLDMHIGTTFPELAPDCFFHSWTGGKGRVNPNLYEDGKICLSLLGTWPSDEKNEGWSSSKSTILQILVSLLGLVLVEKPYYSKSLQCSHTLPYFLSVSQVFILDMEEIS